MKKVFFMLMLLISGYGISQDPCEVLDEMINSSGFFYSLDGGRFSGGFSFDEPATHDWAVRFVWEFSDGTTFEEWSLETDGEPGTNASHLFTALGDQVICVHITLLTGAGSCERTICETVTVEPGNSCSYAPGMDVSTIAGGLCTNQLFQATGALPLGVSIVNVNWNFGDGLGGSGQPASHNYSSPGIYSVCMEVTTSNGTETCTQTFCESIFIGDC